MPFDTNLDWACENKPGYLLLKTLSLVSSGGTRTGGQCPETVTLGSCVQIPRNPTQLRALMREDQYEAIVLGSEDPRASVVVLFVACRACCH